MSYIILPDIEFKNSPDQCNNESCPNKTIYWNPAVKNKETGRAMPLNEPFIGNMPPSPHTCWQRKKKTYGDPIIDSINYSKDLYQYLKSIGVAH